ncbi:uncharacterized protein LOC111714576 [Eurytemora carolleeae]|uniref:uncharacterized protein LOC111714576 n=1 Tax=Eurytemora carolleeae TaxID=1294199 RepID=UPI000C78FB13|nr:uncharacterized protein LOC111714576 [Eurytemora carolleeae]|eukprot:XP_023345482.1 uncharacterized protein LOC111714576 [Eurytemora affinis]
MLMKNIVLICGFLVNNSRGRLDYNSECKDAIRHIGLPRIWKDDSNSSHPLKYFYSIEFQFSIANKEQENDEKVLNTGWYSTVHSPMLSCLDQESPQLADIIRESLLRNGSTDNYRLFRPLEYHLKNPEQVPLEVDQIVFQGKLKDGFFIEAGAHNFEYFSDSLYFELNHGWKGLLVEPHPGNYKEGMSKNRKVSSINTCLSPLPRVSTIPFSLNRPGVLLVDDETENTGLSLQCYPLFSILQAMGNPTVNYFSLDIEGGEFQVLKTIPWDKVDIQVLSVETHFAGLRSEGSRDDIIEYMKSVGYQYLQWGHQVTTTIQYKDGSQGDYDLVNDLFVKNGIPVINIYQ